MKKVFAFVFALAVIFAAAGCAKEEDKTVNIVAPDGAPALVFAKMMADGGNIGGREITYDIVQGADVLKAKVLSGEADIAVMPTNIAATVYNGGINIKLLSVNVHGSLYMVGKQQITDLNLLKGKTVYNIGQGGTPDITFKYILAQNNIEINGADTVDINKVTLKYVSATSELIPMLKTGQAEYGIMGEPAVAQAMNVINYGSDTENNVVVSLDIQEEWDKITDGDNSSYPQASLIAKAEIITKYPELIEEILNRIDSNTAWLADNPEAAKTALASNKSAMAVLNADVISRSNVRLLRAEDAKPAVINYLSVLKNINPAIVGGKLPDDNFFYI